MHLQQWKHRIVRGLAACLMVMLMVAPAATAAAAESALVPLRSLAEAAGATVGWDGETSTVTVITADGITATLQVGDAEAALDGQAVPLGEAAVLVNDRTMVPQAFMDSLLGMPVAYDPATGEANADPQMIAARTFLRDLVAGNVTDLPSRFSPGLQAAVPAELLATVAPGLAPYGEMGRPLVVGASSNPVHQNVDVLLPFASQPLQATVRFDGQGQIDDWQMYAYAPVPTDTAGSPAYADPARFTEQEVAIGEAPWALPGTLTLPVGEGPFPVVVLVHGSGPSDRDESIGGLKPFRDLAHGLASQGIATLRYDKRTLVHMQKISVISDITLQAEAVEDVLAAVRLLAADERIDAGQIYVAGHSMGGLALPRIFAQDEAGQIHGGIALAAPNDLFDALYRQSEYAVQNGEVPPEQVPFIKSQIEMLRDPAFDPAQPPEGYLLGTPHYWHDLLPKTSALLTGQAQPVLFLQGGRDFQVPASHLESFKADLADRTNVTYQLFPKLNHMFTEGEGEISSMAEYMMPANVPGYVVDAIANWIKAMP